jgi:hypothetical protein
MGHYHNPQIPTRNLHFLVDACNISSYPGSGSLWNDLIGSNHLTLTNSPTFSSAGASSYFTFNGTNQYAAKSSVSDGALIQGPITINVFFSPNSTGTQNVFALTSGGASALQIGVISGTGAIWKFGGTVLLNYQYAGVGTVWHLTYTCDGSNNSKVYINGVLQASGTVATQTGTAGNYSIATFNSSGSELFAGKVYYASIHKTVFSDIEVHKTWAALKKRWGFGAIGGTTAGDATQGGLQGGQ